MIGVTLSPDLFNPNLTTVMYGDLIIGNMECLEANRFKAIPVPANGLHTFGSKGRCIQFLMQTAGLLKKHRKRPRKSDPTLF